MSQKVTTLITEETFERRHSLRSMQAMGNVFKTEDEEEIFDNVYLGIENLHVTDMNTLVKIKFTFPQYLNQYFFYSS